MMKLDDKKKKAVGKNDGKDVNIYASCRAKQPNHTLLKNPSHTHAKAYKTFSVRLGFMSEMTPIPCGFLVFIIMLILSGFYMITGILYALDKKKTNPECWEGGEWLQA